MKDIAAKLCADSYLNMSKRKLPDNPNSDLCDLLNELAEYEKNVARNMYKYKAYLQAARAISEHPTRITSGKEAKQLSGVGEKIAKKIDEFLATGKLEKLERISHDSVATAINLLTRVSGIGPAKAKELADLGIRTIQDLEHHKEKLTHQQLIGLEYFKDFETKIPRQEVEDIEKIIRKQIAQLDDSYIITICGSYRRGNTACGDIDCLVTHPEFTCQKESKTKHTRLSLKDIIKKLESCDLITDTIAQGETKFMGVCRLNKDKPGRRLDIRLTPHDQYYCSILYFTGSDLFNRNMRKHAQEQGFTLNEYSLRPVGITGVLGKPVPITSEQEIFEYIDYPYKAPHERNL